MVCLKHFYLNHFKFFRGCLQQILLGPFLNTLFHLILSAINTNIAFFLYFYVFTMRILYHHGCMTEKRIQTLFLSEICIYLKLIFLFYKMVISWRFKTITHFQIFHFPFSDFRNLNKCFRRVINTFEMGLLFC